MLKTKAGNPNRACNYPLRNIPQALWMEAKHRAIEDNTSLRELILTAIRAYLETSR